MNKLKYTESHPLKPDLVNKFDLSREEFIVKFNNFPWELLLKEQLKANENKIYYSPSINIGNEEGKGLSVSIVGELDDYEFYVCYKRPIIRKKSKWFGLVEYDFYDENFCGIMPEQTKEDAFDAFMFFYDGNFEALEARW